MPKPTMRAGIAILVLAHRADLLFYLLHALDLRFAVFIHMDGKSDLPDFAIPAHARLITPRTEVFWGGWSMMQATLALIDAARAAGPHRRYVLVSGDALPVLPADLLEAKLLDDSREFIELRHVPDDPSLAGQDMQAAIARHGWVQPWRLHNPVAWDHRLLNPFHREAAAAHYCVSQDRLDWIRGDLERLTRDMLAHLRPSRPFREFFYGAQWWALTAATLEAILPELRDADMQRFFRFIQMPDEHMLQTMLGNRRDILAATSVAGTPMWTDHENRAHGRDTLDDAGFRTAAANGNQIMFARKFSADAAPDTAEAIRAGEYLV